MPTNKQFARRGFGLLALVLIFITATAVSAFARTGNGPINVSSTYVEYDGDIYWWANGVNHGGMEVSGKLWDRECDGDWVYVEAKVSGYGYTRLRENHEGCGNFVNDAATVVFDPQATKVFEGYVKACKQDAFSDTCVSEYMHR